MERKKYGFLNFSDFGDEEMFILGGIRYKSRYIVIACLLYVSVDNVSRRLEFSESL